MSKYIRKTTRMPRVTEMISHSKDGLFHFVFDKTHDLDKRDLVFMYDYISNHYLRYPNVVRCTPDFPAMNTEEHLTALKKFQDFIKGSLELSQSDMLEYKRIVKGLSDILTIGDCLRIQDFVLYAYYTDDGINELDDFCSLDRWATAIEDIFDTIDDTLTERVNQNGKH